MAILIFSHEKTQGRPSRVKLAILLVLLTLTSGLIPCRAQHIVTAAARTQAQALVQQGYTAYESGDYAQATLLIDQADKLVPDQADAWNLRGAVYLKQGIFDKADAAFARAVALDPNLWAAQFNLGEVAFHRKDYRRARERFDALLSQTDRRKDANRWELAAYKTFLSCLLMGDDVAAHKKLEKIPAKGATPAYLYAQAALSYSRKDVATAEKTVALAQSTFPPAANDLFGSSFQTVGWQAVPPPLLPASPSSLPLAGGASNAGGSEQPMQIDPRLEAAVADPLPSAGGAVYGKIPEVTTPKQSPAKAPAGGTPAANKAPVSNGHPTPPPAQDHTGLLLE
jgi:Tfp pilus assembly protein PilF